MKKLAVLACTAFLISAGTTAAFGQRIIQECELNTGHFLLRGAVTYLRAASSTRFPDERERHLRDARRVLFDALDRSQDDNPAIWYFLGLYYAETADLIGADSAFDRAETMRADCRDDIQFHRERLGLVGSTGCPGEDEVRTHPVLHSTALPPQPRPRSVSGRTFMVHFCVDARGRVTNVRVDPEMVDLSYLRRFLNTMYETIFLPATANDGTPVPGQAIFRFHL